MDDRPSSTGRVSIVMPAYNAETYLSEAIDSILEQNYQNWELVLVDDGSTDRTREIARACGDSRIHVYVQTNKGEAAARNAALEQLTGDYVAFLDADDRYLPHHLSQTVRYLERHPDDGGVYTDGYYIAEDGRRIATLSSRRRGPFTGRLFDDMVRGSDVFGPPLCVVFRRELLLKHRLRFDEDIVIGPDWDFFVHLTDVTTFGYLETATCLYRVHQTNITFRVGLEKRALELAKCRMSAVAMPSFAACPLDVRVAVFYDLLVNLLRRHPERQREVVEGAAFLALPASEQATVLRLMASKGILFGGDPSVIREWLHLSRRTNKWDVSAALLLALYVLSPALCRTVLRMRTAGQVDPLSVAPMADLAANRP